MQIRKTSPRGRAVLAPTFFISTAPEIDEPDGGYEGYALPHSSPSVSPDTAAGFVY